MGGRGPSGGGRQTPRFSPDPGTPALLSLGPGHLCVLYALSSGSLRGQAKVELGRAIFRGALPQNPEPSAGAVLTSTVRNSAGVLIPGAESRT